MNELKKELKQAKSLIHCALYAEFNLITINPVIKEWYLLDWEMFYKELQKENVDLVRYNKKKWKSFFLKQKNKINNILNQLIEQADCANKG